MIQNVYKNLVIDTTKKNETDCTEIKSLYPYQTIFFLRFHFNFALTLTSVAIQGCIHSVSS